MNYLNKAIYVGTALVAITTFYLIGLVIHTSKIYVKD